MNFTCPQCSHENAYFDFIDERGSHYICPDCDPEYTWIDSSIKAKKEKHSEDNLAMSIFREVFKK